MQQTASNQPPTVVDAQGLTRVFMAKSGPVQALRGIDLRIVPGEMVALRGRSGSGKTTLLNILVGLDDPTEGSLTVLGHTLRQMPEAARARLRRDDIGMLFQNAHLFPALTAQENVELPLRLARMDTAERNRRATEALALVGLSARSRHRGTELSGGEQQRVALARALVHAPRFVVADEPTGNLDSMTGRTVIEMLHTIAQQTGIAFLVATHDMTVVDIADRVVSINDGRLSQ